MRDYSVKSTQYVSTANLSNQESVSTLACHRGLKYQWSYYMENRDALVSHHGWCHQWYLLVIRGHSRLSSKLLSNSAMRSSLLQPARGSICESFLGLRRENTLS